MAIENLENEIWLDIIGYENYYQVSSKGRVKRLAGTYNCNEDRLLKPSIGTNGYYYVILSKNCKCKPHTIHRLVAQAFIPNPDNLPCVNHKDENKLNNVVLPPNECNLEWVTYKENTNWGTAKERSSKAQKGRECNAKAKEILSKPVYQLDKITGEIINTFPSAKEAERALNNGKINFNINAVCNNKPKCKTAYGFGWRWV